MIEPRNAYRLKPSLSQKWGQHRCDRQGKGTSVRPGSRSGAKTRDGSPGDLRDPIGVHVSEPELRVAGIQDPGPGGDLRPSRSATAPRAQWRTQTQRDHVGGGSEQRWHFKNPRNPNVDRGPGPGRVPSHPEDPLRPAAPVHGDLQRGRMSDWSPAPPTPVPYSGLATVVVHGVQMPLHGLPASAMPNGQQRPTRLGRCWVRRFQ